MNKPNFEKKDEIKEGVKYDSEKPRFDLTPPLAWLELAKVLTFGAKKYAPNNWKKLENIEERCTAAALRHIQAFMSGEIARMAGDELDWWKEWREFVVTEKKAGEE